MLIRCNQCMCILEEFELIRIVDEDGITYGCPFCKTDSYLMDIPNE